MSDQELHNGLLEVFKALIPLINFIFYLTTGTIYHLLPGDSTWVGTGGSTFMFYWQYLTKYRTLICMKQKFLHFDFTADRGKAALTSVKLWNIFLYGYLILITLTEYQGKNVLLCLLTPFSKKVLHRKKLFSPTYTILTIWFLVSFPNCSIDIHGIETPCLCIYPRIFFFQHIFQSNLVS